MDNQEQTERQGFIVEAKGPNGILGVFEDDGDMGYLYIYEPAGAGIVQHLHTYDRVQNSCLNRKERRFRSLGRKQMLRCYPRLAPRSDRGSTVTMAKYRYYTY